MKRVLVVDDEEAIRDFVSRGLADCGYKVTVAADGEEAWRLMQDCPPDLALLDVRMPLLSGIDLCRRLRQEKGIALPVIMLTALGQTDDIVLGLRAGADDYVVKPFKFTELTARIEALLRRSAHQPDELHYRDLMLDPKGRLAVRAGRVVELSAKEFRLLHYMMTHCGQVLSKQQLLRDVWDKDFDPSTNIVEVYISYLRGKIDGLFDEKLVHTVVGKGYRFGE